MLVKLIYHISITNDLFLSINIFRFVVIINIIQNIIQLLIYIIANHQIYQIFYIIYVYFLIHYFLLSKTVIFEYKIQVIKTQKSGDIS